MIGTMFSNVSCYDEIGVTLRQRLPRMATSHIDRSFDNAPGTLVPLGVILASCGTCALFQHHDLGANSPIVSRFLPREKAHDCSVVAAFAGRAQFAVHQRRHEPVRADFSGTTKAVMEAGASGQ